MDRTSTARIDGMTCANCAAHVTEALAALPAVLDVSVELRSGETSPVTLVHNDPLDAEAVRSAVDGAGYTLVSLN